MIGKPEREDGREQKQERNEQQGNKMVWHKSWERWKSRQEPVDDVVVPRFEG